jgi:WhiB family redox-sensing transcriptional regulator
MTKWMQHAVCVGVDSEIFFPEVNNAELREHHWANARQYCQRCPVQAECLAYQLVFESATGRRDGMWGGMTPKERDQHVFTPTRITWKR